MSIFLFSLLCLCRFVLFPFSCFYLIVLLSWFSRRFHVFAAVTETWRESKNNSDSVPLLSAAPAAGRPHAVRALAQLSLAKADKPNVSIRSQTLISFWTKRVHHCAKREPGSCVPHQETPQDLIPDESTMWGARYNSLNSLAACPNSTSDFALLAQFVSTPFAHKTFCSGGDFEDRGMKRRPAGSLFLLQLSHSCFCPPENTCDDHKAADGENTRRQTKKLR